MALREIRTIGDPILTKKAKEIKIMTPRIRELIADMFDTLHDANGAGLAGPQVGVLKRITVIEVEEGKPYVLINPHITSSEGEQTGYEGCLSVPGKSGVVTRPAKVTVEALDGEMKPFTLEAEGLLARCICHELDHLDGGLYVDRVEGELIDNEKLEKMEQEQNEKEAKQKEQEKPE
jgi:peptide deformylase